MTASKYWQINTLKIQNLIDQSTRNIYSGEICTVWPMLTFLALGPTSPLHAEVAASLPHQHHRPPLPKASQGCCATKTQVCCPCQSRGCLVVKLFRNTSQISFYTRLWERKISLVGGGASAAIPQLSQHHVSHFA